MNLIQIEENKVAQAHLHLMMNYYSKKIQQHGGLANNKEEAQQLLLRALGREDVEYAIIKACIEIARKSNRI